MLWIKFVPFGLALLFALLGLIMRMCRRRVLKQLNYKKSRCSVETSATIVDLYRVKVDENTTCFPVYKFSCDDKQVVIKNDVSVNPARMRVGKVVNLYYNPEDVREIYVPEERAGSSAGVFKLMSIMLMIVAIILVGLGIWFMIKF